jgi:hypothetical protein
LTRLTGEPRLCVEGRAKVLILGPATPTHEIDAYNYDYASSTFNDGYGGF